ncbi:MAG: hypothetical protein GY814_05675 [Gammaproteobacteria bacterium]|nr:hypothetical protein [Gammaproteobacteria bacterium]
MQSEDHIEKRVYNRAVEEATSKWESKFRKTLSKRTTESAYSQYQIYREWGCIDEDGNFPDPELEPARKDLTGYK